MLRPFGAVLGAIVLVGGLEVFRAAAETRLLVYGLVLLLLVRFRPQGLWTLPLPFAGIVRRITGRGPSTDAAGLTVPSVKLAGTLAPVAPVAPVGAPAARSEQPDADGTTPDDGATSAHTEPKEVHA